MKRLKTALWLGLVILAASCKTVFAGVVEPSGLNDITDKKAIQAELDATGSVTLKPGASYFLTGPLYISSNMSIEATGATITADKDLMMNEPSQTGYGSLNGFSVNGGTWLSSSSSGYDKSSMKFAHAQNLKFTNMTVKHANYSGHGLELIACQDVLVENCSMTAVGSPKKGSVEEMIQLDIAASKTAPSMYALKPSLANGACCRNITIKGCTVTGCRGICANFAAAAEDAKYKDKFHSNIVIENNTITGAVSEGLALFNVMSAKVSGNTIICANSSKGDHSVGCHIGTFGKGKTKSIVISGNTIKGKWYALQLWSPQAKYKKITVKNNRLYAKNKKAVVSTNTENATLYVTKKYVYSNNKNFKY